MGDLRTLSSRSARTCEGADADDRRGVPAACVVHASPSTKATRRSRRARATSASSRSTTRPAATSAPVRSPRSTPIAQEPPTCRSPPATCRMIIDGVGLMGTQRSHPARDRGSVDLALADQAGGAPPVSNRRRRRELTAATRPTSNFATPQSRVARTIAAKGRRIESVSARLSPRCSGGSPWELEIGNWELSSPCCRTTYNRARNDHSGRDLRRHREGVWPDRRAAWRVVRRERRRNLRPARSERCGEEHADPHPHGHHPRRQGPGDGVRRAAAPRPPRSPGLPA